MCYLASVVDARAVEIVHVANRQVQLPQQRGGSSDGSSDLQSTLPRCDSAVSSYDGALGGPSPYPLLPQNGLQDAQSCFMLHSSSSSALQPAYEQLLHAQAPEAVPAKQACSPGGPSALASPQREPGAGAEGKGERADSMVSSYTAGALLMV